MALSSRRYWIPTYGREPSWRCHSRKPFATRLWPMPAPDFSRAVLFRDSIGNIRVRCEMWDLSDWESYSGAFWNQVTQGTTISDTIDNARLLARERLLELGESGNS